MWYQYKEDIITVSIYVQPGARSTEIAGLHGNDLKIRLKTPPIEGRANAALLQYLAHLFEVSARQVKLVRGEKSRHKTLTITGSSIDPGHLIIPA